MWLCLDVVQFWVYRIARYDFISIIWADHDANIWTCNPSTRWTCYSICSLNVSWQCSIIYKPLNCSWWIWVFGDALIIETIPNSSFWWTNQSYISWCNCNKNKIIVKTISIGMQPDVTKFTFKTAQICNKFMIMICVLWNVNSLSKGDDRFWI